MKRASFIPRCGKAISAIEFFLHYISRRSLLKQLAYRYTIHVLLKSRKCCMSSHLGSNMSLSCHTRRDIYILHAKHRAHKFRDCAKGEMGKGRSNTKKKNARLIRGLAAQNRAWPGHLGKGMMSRIFSSPVAKSTRRSKPKPKPEWGMLPYFRRSM